MTTDQPGQFGFTVGEIQKADGGGWFVSLPHQCGTWDVAGDDSYDGDPHESAVAALERFIAEAAAALTALRSRQPFGDHERYTQPDDDG